MSMTYRAQGVVRRVVLKGLVWGGTNREEEGRELGGGEKETGRRGGYWDDGTVARGLLRAAADGDRIWEKCVK